MEKELKGRELWAEVLSGVSQATLEVSPYFAHQIRGNIRHVLITFSRYKFAARMLGDQPQKTVLELGCNEGIGTLHLAQVASHATAVDFDERAIKYAKENLEGDNLKFIHADFLGKKFGAFDAVVSLDVIEHIDQEKEDEYLQTVLTNLNPKGFAIIGTPNITASPYASEASRLGHINLYDHQRFKELFLKGFDNVFMFGMNDEVVHTGFLPMTHYLMALCIGPKGI